MPNLIYRLDSGQFQPHGILTHEIFNFRSSKTIFASSPTRTILISNGVESACTSFDTCEKYVRECLPTPNAHAKVKTRIFPISQEIGSTLVSFQMIFETLPSELFRFDFHSLSSKILKIWEFNLLIIFLGWSRSYRFHSSIHPRCCQWIHCRPRTYTGLKSEKN